MARGHVKLTRKCVISLNDAPPVKQEISTESKVYPSTTYRYLRPDLSGLHQRRNKKGSGFLSTASLPARPLAPGSRSRAASLQPASAQEQERISVPIDFQRASAAPCARFPVTGREPATSISAGTRKDQRSYRHPACQRGPLRPVPGHGPRACNQHHDAVHPKLDVDWGPVNVGFLSCSFLDPALINRA
jgi:hypothetical protein